MSERLVHRRTKGPASTPAQRLVELQQELSHTQRQLDDTQTAANDLAAKLARFHELSEVSFGGIPAAQIWADFILWESLLNSHKFRAVFELGTWQGGFSWWLWAQTKCRTGMNFYTYDAVIPDRWVPEFERRDVFAESAYIGKTMRLSEPCIVLCDNGNKPRELETFSLELRTTDSLLVVHDWGTEMLPENVPGNVEMVYEEFCVGLGSISRVFRIKENDADQ